MHIYFTNNKLFKENYTIGTYNQEQVNIVYSAGNSNSLSKRKKETNDFRKSSTPLKYLSHVNSYIECCMRVNNMYNLEKCHEIK